MPTKKANFACSTTWILSLRTKLIIFLVKNSHFDWQKLKLIAIMNSQGKNPRISNFGHKNQTANTKPVNNEASLYWLRKILVNLTKVSQKVRNEALHCIIVIGFLIKIWIELIILQLLKSDFKVIFLIHSKLSKLGVFW